MVECHCDRHRISSIWEREGTVIASIRSTSLNVRIVKNSWCLLCPDLNSIGLVFRLFFDGDLLRVSAGSIIRFCGFSPLFFPFTTAKIGAFGPLSDSCVHICPNNPFRTFPIKPIFFCVLLLLPKIVKRVLLCNIVSNFCVLVWCFGKVRPRWSDSIVFLWSLRVSSWCSKLQI